jgi:hypothetical protein
VTGSVAAKPSVAAAAGLIRFVCCDEHWHKMRSKLRACVRAYVVGVFVMRKRDTLDGSMTNERSVPRKVRVARDPG